MEIHLVLFFLHQLNGDSLWQLISVRGIARAIAERPELDMALNSLENITLGELYRTMFPEGVLKKLGVQLNTNRLVVDEFHDEVRFVEDEISNDLIDKTTNPSISDLNKSQTIIEFTERPTTAPNQDSDLTSSTPIPKPLEVTAKVNQTPLHTIFAENESARITRSTTLTSVPQRLETLPVPDKLSSSGIKPNSPAIIRPSSVGFNSNEAGEKLREWIKTYLSG